MLNTYKIYTLGCKVNQYDSGKLAAELERAGFIAVKRNAVFAIISSCAVTKTAINKSARMVKLAKKENPKAKIVLAGCWTRVKDGETATEGINLVIKAGDVKEIIKQISNFQYPIFKQIKNPKIKNNKIVINNNRSRYFIKIQDGCEQYCTYCIIPYVRGNLKSSVESEVIAEIKQAVAAGHREVILSGIHLGLYGKDTGDKLVNLLKKLITIKDLSRIRLSSIEITEVSDEIIKLMTLGKICRHLHIPMQSGSDKILRLMNRPYDTKYFARRIKQIRKQVPSIAISTDVITGFPGETDKEFKETKNFIKKINFSRLHVFPFSPHAMLPAAKLPDQVKENERLKRAKVLRKLSVKLAEDYKKRFKNKNLEIVIEQIRPDRIIGKTEYYFDVEIARKKLKDNDLKIGQIVEIKN